MPAASWFTKALLPWYRAHRRDLPWRRTREPYRIWLSEVILQQTRVDQGLAYYERFLAAYPTIEALAAASETEVLRLWQGLGYYSRGRNLLLAARQVVQTHGGRFPQEAPALLKLKGVGAYTAAAVSSIAFGRPEAVVDGNVQRVLARVFGIHTPVDSTAGQRELQALAGELLDPEAPGDHNQAVMELGATVCLPRNPRCTDCPLKRNCRALKAGLINELPVKGARKAARPRFFQFIELEQNGEVFLQERKGKDIWKGLYHFPLLESEGPLDPKAMCALMAEATGTRPDDWDLVHQSAPIKHLLTHQRLEAVFWTYRMERSFPIPAGWLRVPKKEMGRWPMPRLMLRYLEAR